MARIYFTVLSNPAKLNIPAYAMDTDEAAPPVLVGWAIARANRAYPRTNFTQSMNAGRDVWATYMVRRTAGGQELLGEVQFAMLP